MIICDYGCSLFIVCYCCLGARPTSFADEIGTPDPD